MSSTLSGLPRYAACRYPWYPAPARLLPALSRRILEDMATIDNIAGFTAMYLTCVPAAVNLLLQRGSGGRRLPYEQIVVTVSWMASVERIMPIAPKFWRSSDRPLAEAEHC